MDIDYGALSREAAINRANLINQNKESNMYSAVSRDVSSAMSQQTNVMRESMKQNSVLSAGLTTLTNSITSLISITTSTISDMYNSFNRGLEITYQRSANYQPYLTAQMKIEERQLSVLSSIHQILYSRMVAGGADEYNTSIQTPDFWTRFKGAGFAALAGSLLIPTIKLIAPHLPGIGTIISETWGALSGVVSGLYHTTTGIYDAFDNIHDATAEAVANVSSHTADLSSTINDYYSKLSDTVRDTLSSEDFTNFSKNMMEQARQLNLPVDEFKDFVKENMEKMYGVSDDMSAYYNDLTTRYHDLSNAVHDAYDNAISSSKIVTLAAGYMASSMLSTYGQASDFRYQGQGPTVGMRHDQTQRQFLQNSGQIREQGFFENFFSSRNLTYLATYLMFGYTGLLYQRLMTSAFRIIQGAVNGLSEMYVNSWTKSLIRHEERQAETRQRLRELTTEKSLTEAMTIAFREGLHTEIDHNTGRVNYRSVVGSNTKLEDLKVNLEQARVNYDTHVTNVSNTRDQEQRRINDFLNIVASFGGGVSGNTFPSTPGTVYTTEMRDRDAYQMEVLRGRAIRAEMKLEEERNRISKNESNSITRLAGFFRRNNQLLSVGAVAGGGLLAAGLTTMVAPGMGILGAGLIGLASTIGLSNSTIVESLERGFTGLGNVLEFLNPRKFFSNLWSSFKSGAGRIFEGIGNLIPGSVKDMRIFQILGETRDRWASWARDRRDEKMAQANILRERSKAADIRLLEAVLGVEVNSNEEESLIRAGQINIRNGRMGHVNLDAGNVLGNYDTLQQGGVLGYLDSINRSIELGNIITDTFRVDQYNLMNDYFHQRISNEDIFDTGAGAAYTSERDLQAEIDALRTMIEADTATVQGQINSGNRPDQALLDAIQKNERRIFDAERRIYLDFRAEGDIEGASAKDYINEMSKFTKAGGEFFDVHNNKSNNKTQLHMYGDVGLLTPAGIASTGSPVRDMVNVLVDIDNNIKNLNEESEDYYKLSKVEIKQNIKWRKLEERRYYESLSEEKKKELSERVVEKEKGGSFLLNPTFLGLALGALMAATGHQHLAYFLGMSKKINVPALKEFVSAKFSDKLDDIYKFTRGTAEAAGDWFKASKAGKAVDAVADAGSAANNWFKATKFAKGVDAVADSTKIGSALSKLATGSKNMMKAGKNMLGTAATKLGAKAAGFGSKLLPGLAIGAGIADAGMDIANGDYVGAGLAIAAAATSVIPGVSWGLTAAITTIDMARDWIMDSQKREQETKEDRINKEKDFYKFIMELKDKEKFDEAARKEIMGDPNISDEAKTSYSKDYYSKHTQENQTNMDDIDKKIKEYKKTVAVEREAYNSFGAQLGRMGDNFVNFFLGGEIKPMVYDDEHAHNYTRVLEANKTRIEEKQSRLITSGISNYLTKEEIADLDDAVEKHDQERINYYRDLAKERDRKGIDPNNLDTNKNENYDKLKQEENVDQTSNKTDIDKTNKELINTINTKIADLVESVKATITKTNNAPVVVNNTNQSSTSSQVTNDNSNNEKSSGIEYIKNTLRTAAIAAGKTSKELSYQY